MRSKRFVESALEDAAHALVRGASMLHYVGEPNRYGLPAFHELYVWTWKRNPEGDIADWNAQVACDTQPSD